MSHKQFLLFSFPEFYPSGGLGDITEEFDTEQAARAYIEKNLYNLSEYAYLFDCQTRNVIWSKD